MESEEIQEMRSDVVDLWSKIVFEYGNKIGKNILACTAPTYFYIMIDLFSAPDDNGDICHRVLSPEKTIHREFNLADETSVERIMRNYLDDVLCMDDNNKTIWKLGLSYDI